MNPLAQQARDHHRQAAAASQVAQSHRDQRDELVRRIWATEREKWTHASLATAVGCSPELIAKIIRTGE